MSERFAAIAVPLCGKVCRALGWRPAHFWLATPAELRAVLTDDEGQAGLGVTRTELTAMLEQDRDE